MDRPRDVAHSQWMQDDPSAAELYSLLPEEVQSMVQQNNARMMTATDVERMARDYIDEL